MGSGLRIAISSSLLLASSLPSGCDHHALTIKGGRQPRLPIRLAPIRLAPIQPPAIDPTRAD